MKCLLISLIAIFVTKISSYPNEQDASILDQWNDFKNLYKKTYTRSENIQRMQIFQNNLEKINEHNKLFEENEVTYKLKVNKFADMTNEDFLESFTGSHYSANLSNDTFLTFPSVSVLPDEIDWREKGAVTEVKNQEVDICGACWAFSATGALEGQNFLRTGDLISLSEQELVDCIIARSARGCHGGFVEDAYTYIEVHGLSTEADYPYQASDGTCHRDSLPSAVTETGHVLVFGNESTLKEAVATVGPISVLVNTPNWQFYSEGIFYEPDECKSDANSLNHAVLAVGYGTDNGTDYWLVKNSYGADWGENGYIRMRRNANNNCGIATRPSYPVV